MKVDNKVVLYAALIGGIFAFLAALVPVVCCAPPEPPDSAIGTVVFFQQTFTCYDI